MEVKVGVKKDITIAFNWELKGKLIRCTHGS